MKIEEVKRQMMSLWKENFHDNDAYIRLVFDAYFDPDYIEYEEENGQIIASLIAIPYTFGNNKNTINSVYLCGLSTSLKHRNKGIMTALMDRIEHKMRIKGIAFIFLIPADGGLRRYYSDRGYIAGFYRNSFHFTSIHDFKREYLSSLLEENKASRSLKESYFYGLQAFIIDNKIQLSEDEKSEITTFIMRCQDAQRGLSLYQTDKQIGIVIDEALLSNSFIIVCRNQEMKISGIAFYDVTNEEIIEKGRYTENYASLCKIREKVISKSEDRSLTIRQYGYDRHAEKTIWNPLYSSVLPGAAQVGTVGMMERVYNPNRFSEIYGMVKIISIYEILKFQAKHRNGVKYSILMRQANDDKIIEFSAKDGHVNKRELDYEIEYDSHDILESRENKNRKLMYVRDKGGYEKIIMSEHDLGELLFRKPDIDNVIEETFGLPAINGRISLLLD